MGIIMGSLALQLLGIGSKQKPLVLPIPSAQQWFTQKSLIYINMYEQAQIRGSNQANQVMSSIFTHAY